MPTDRRPPNGAPQPYIAMTGGPVESGDTVPQNTIDPERLRSVLSRLVSGFYDSVEVQDRIAARVLSEV